MQRNRDSSLAVDRCVGGARRRFHTGRVRHVLNASVVVFLAVPLVAQTKDDGQLWSALVLQGRFGDKESGLDRWRWMFDLQDRQRDEGEHFELGVVRPAVGYAITDRLVAHLGYGWFVADPKGRDEFGEHRPWQQLTWNIPVGDVTVQSRTRLEQRFVETDGDTGWRLREFVKTTVPLSADKRVFASVWDELFWDLDDTDWGQRAGFRQNRAFVGPGWFLGEGKHVSLEVGYLNQWVDRPGEDKLNHVLSIWLFVNF
jgi:hypothetical protein